MDLLDSCKDPEQDFSFSYEPGGDFSDPSTGNRWRRTEQQVFGVSRQDFESIMGLMIFDDESFQGQRGDLKVAALIVSLSNFKTKYFEKPEAKRVLGYKPKIQLSAKLQKRKAGRLYKFKFDDECFKGIREELKHAQNVGGFWYFFHNLKRRFVLYTHMLPTDSKQGDIACRVFGSWNSKRACRLCDKPTKTFGEPPYVGAFRTQASTTACHAELNPGSLLEMSLQPVMSPWYDVWFGDTEGRSVHDSTPVEGLHTINLGIHQKFCHWTRDIIYDTSHRNAQVLDDRILLLNNSLWPRTGSGLPLKRRFPGLPPAMGALPGSEYASIIFLLIFVIGEAGALVPVNDTRPLLKVLLGSIYLQHLCARYSVPRDEVDHMEIQIENFVKMFKKVFMNSSPTGTDFPKLHYLFHFPHQIREFGSGRNFSGSTYESFLIEAVKKPAVRTRRHGTTFATDLMRRCRLLLVLGFRSKLIQRLWKKHANVHPENTASRFPTTPAGRDRVGGVTYSLSSTGTSAQSYQQIVHGTYGVSAALSVAQNEGDSTVVEFLRGALQSTNLTCHERLTILPTVASEKIVLHCEPDGTPNRRRDWVMIHWEDGVGTHPARLEAIFNAGPNSNFIAVSSLDISPPNDRRTAAIPFIRKMLSSTIYVLQTTSISAEAVVIEDLDTPGCFWLVPEFKHWPDVLSSV